VLRWNQLIHYKERTEEMDLICLCCSIWFA